MVERGLDAVEGIGICNGVGGNVVPVGTGCAGSRLFTGIVGHGEVGLQGLPRLVSCGE